MQVKGKSIRSSAKVAVAAQGCDEIKITFKVTDDVVGILVDIGFDLDLAVGDYLIPKPVGKTTQVNARGKEIVRKDLPMEPQVRTSYRTWKDWHGQEHTGTQSRSVDMYPREYVQAQEEALHIIEVDKVKYVATKTISMKDEDEDRVVHLANLMLECFGSFNVLDVQNGRITSAKIKQLHWDILPPGPYPWSRARPLVGEITKRLNKSDQGVVESRMQIISNYSPDFLAMGRAGFSGYFIYGFSKKDKYVLESAHLDNATYVFGSDWESMSKLTKNQILNGEVKHKRIIHDKKWRREIRETLIA